MTPIEKELLDDLEEKYFTTWEKDGRVFHEVGLMQIWWRGYCDADRGWTDPPEFSKEFTEWLEKHDSRVVEFGIGPPVISFPSNEVAVEFCFAWHKPGEIQRLAYFKRCRENQIPLAEDRGTVEEQHARMTRWMQESRVEANLWREELRAETDDWKRRHNL